MIILLRGIALPIILVTSVFSESLCQGFDIPRFI